ncbi:MAG: exodeoxyribonuclease III [Candidatus Puniceispirillaceae bacterium]
MRIATWNVNSVKARLAHVIEYCKAGHTDILLLQELKMTDENFPYEAFADIGWQVAVHGQKTYNGVAILSPHPIEQVERRLAGDDEDEQARFIQAKIMGLHVASLYLPNGNPCPGPKFDYKLKWMDRLHEVASDLLASERPVILGGDYNIIPQAIDCYDENAWQGDALYHEESRSRFFKLLHLGYTDAFRSIHPNGPHFSFWDYQAGAWQKNNGIRIDHLLLSPEAANRLSGAGIDKGPRGLERASDHTPVWCELTMSSQ